MTKYIALLLMLAVPLFAQQRLSAVPFVTGNDTIANIDKQDTLYFQLSWSGLNWPGEWQQATICMQDTAFVTVEDKAAEVTKVFDLSGETKWAWAPIMRLRILSDADTLISNAVSLADLNLGTVSVFVQPDTSGTNTIYKVRVGGR